MKLPFTKMHGLGNDFIVIDGYREKIELDPNLARRLCDRHFGIGADQILWVKPPLFGQADARMEILNADGSVAEMCGNGIRAVALYLNRYSQNRKLEYRIETLAGLNHVKINPDGELVSVDMGKPVLGAGLLEEQSAPQALAKAPARVSERYDGENLKLPTHEVVSFFEVSMGNPHAVIFVEDLERVPAAELGRRIEIHPRFPKRTNVEFVQVMGPSAIQVRVWERGAGLTLACGTGACAAAVAALQTQRAKNPVAVFLPGGVLRVIWNGPGQPVIMEGSATEVFRGEIDLQ